MFPFEATTNVFNKIQQLTFRVAFSDIIHLRVAQSLAYSSGFVIT